MAFILLALVAPFLTLAAAFLNAAILCIPLMWVLNWTHGVIPAIPALELWPTFLIIMVVSLLFGRGSVNAD